MNEGNASTGTAESMRIDQANRTVSLDIRDPNFYNDPYPAYEILQNECPVFFWEEHKLWTFTSFKDVATILRDRRFGRQISHLKSRSELGLPPIREELKPFFDVDQLSMLGLEPPAHTRLRGLVQKAFMARQIEHLRPNIESLCHRLVDDLIDSQGAGAVDVLERYATPVPVYVIAQMLGVPTEMAPELLRWSHVMVKMYEMERTSESELAAVQASREFVAYLRTLVNERRLNPKDDLISELIEVESGGEKKLTEDELISNCILLLNAGHEATVNLIGNGLLALLKNPAQLSIWRSSGHQDETFFQNAVEELMRFDTPLHQFNRWVLEPVELYGHQFSVGDEVALLLGAANRDASEFASPHSLDLKREHNAHVSLGGGIHYCLGAPLARLEVQIAIRVLLERLDSISLAEEPVFKNTYHFHGLESLNVRLS